MHAAFFRSVVESPDAAGGAHLGERGPLKAAATQGTFHTKLGRRWRCSLGIPVLARCQRADRVRSACLCSRSRAIPPRAPSPGKGTQTGGPSCPGRVSAAAARGRGGSPGGLAGGMSPPSLPPSGGGNVGAPSRGPTRLGRAGGASQPHSSPALRALHRIVLVGAPPRGQLRRRTAARVGLREPAAGGRVRGVPRMGISGGDPNPDNVVWLSS